MILIPQRLFDQAQVTTLLREGNVCILYKELTDPVIQREGYLSNHVLSLLLEGEQLLQTYEDHSIRLRAGEALFIPRGLYHITDLVPRTGSFRSLLFYFDDALAREFLATTSVAEVRREALPEFLRLGKEPSLQRLAQNLLDLYRDTILRGGDLLRLKILELFHLLHALLPERDFASFLFRLTLPQKRNLKTFIEQNYTKPLKVEDFAYLTGRSLSTFRRDFKAFYQSTPQKWLRDKRLEKALHILHERDISIGELAQTVGYDNVSYFIKAFKSKVGLSPKQYLLSRRGSGFEHH